MRVADGVAVTDPEHMQKAIALVKKIEALAADAAQHAIFAAQIYGGGRPEFETIILEAVMRKIEGRLCTLVAEKVTTK